MLTHALLQKLISKQNNEEHSDLHRDHGHKGLEEFPSHFPQSDTLYPSLWQPTSSCYFNCEIHEHSLTLLIVLMCTEGLVAATRTDLLPWSHHGDLVQNTIVHLNHELESFSAGSSEIESRQPKVTLSTARGPSPLSCSSGLLPVSNGTCSPRSVPFFCSLPSHCLQSPGERLICSLLQLLITLLVCCSTHRREDTWISQGEF